MTELTDLSETDASNTTVSTVNIAEGCNPSDVNNGMRAILGLIRRAFKTSIFRLRDSTDQTKLLAFDLSGLTSGATRTLKLPDANLDLSGSETGSFVGTVVGCTTSPTITFNYVKVGKLITISPSDAVGVTGTSNSTTKSISGLPAALAPAGNSIFIGSGSDNGGTFQACYSYVGSGSLVLLYTPTGTGWTASGTWFYYVPTISYVGA